MTSPSHVLGGFQLSLDAVVALIGFKVIIGN